MECSKRREDIKKDKSAILFDGLMNYGLYGTESPFTNVLSNKELREIKPGELVTRIKDFTKMPHRVLYYGPKPEKELLTSLNTIHTVPDQMKALPAAKDFKMTDVNAPSALWVDYDMVQEEVMFVIKGDPFDKTRIAYSRLYNEYMAGQVFRELREAQGLAYATFTSYNSAGKANGNDSFFGYIGAQADKQAESINALKEIIYTMPKTEDGFNEAKDAVLSVMESERIVKTGVLFNYLTAEKRGLDYDVRKDVYEQVQKMSLSDIGKFQEDNIRNKKYNLVLLGSKDKINFRDLNKYGAVKQVSLDELFGYEKVEKINLEKSPNN